jgi:anti-sigma B factor antagonist
LEITTRTDSNVLIVDFEGRLDTQTSGPAADRMDEITAAGNKNILLNLEKLEFISSAGLRVFLRTSKQLKSSGGNMKACSPNGVVKEVMEISGFNSLFDLHDSEQAALEAF